MLAPNAAIYAQRPALTTADRRLHTKMHPASKLAAYVLLLVFSWPAANSAGLQLSRLTTCALMTPAETNAVFRAYAIHFAYYLGSSFAGSRRDKATTVHHVATITLLPLSWSFLGAGGVRVGMLTMFVHGLTDAALQVTRLCPQGPLKTATGVGMLASWIAMRIIYFGRVVHAVYNAKEAEYAECGNADAIYAYWALALLLLGTLWCLNVYWAGLVVRKLTR